MEIAITSAAVIVWLALWASDPNGALRIISTSITSVAIALRDIAAALREINETLNKDK